MEKFFNRQNIIDQDIWRKLTTGAPRRIKYSIKFIDDIQTELVFETSGIEQICIYLMQHDNIKIMYLGQCRSMIILSSYGKIFCDSEYEMFDVFEKIENDYILEKANSLFFIDDEDDENFEEDTTQKKYGACYIDSDNITKNLKSKIVGQDKQIDEIVECVSNHLKKPNPKKPMSIMLSGPTGVGKTATAKHLANELAVANCGFNSKIITINCNEYKEEYRISQLLGSPAGYAGYDEVTLLDPIKETNSLIILLDEYEKAHPNIHAAVMGWFDNGIITLARADEDGVFEHDCSRSIIILTSNIKMDRKGSVGFSVDDKPTDGQVGLILKNSSDACRQIMVDNGFKPEIASRIGHFVEYRKLSKDDMDAIIKISIKNTAMEYGVEIKQIKSSLQNDIARKYGVSAFGVRSLISDIDRLIGKHITKDIQHGEYILGGTLEKMIFTKKEPNEKNTVKYK